MAFQNSVVAFHISFNLVNLFSLIQSVNKNICNCQPCIFALGSKSQTMFFLFHTSLPAIKIFWARLFPQLHLSRHIVSSEVPKVQIRAESGNAGTRLFLLMIYSSSFIHNSWLCMTERVKNKNKTPFFFWMWLTLLSWKRTCYFE